MQEKPSEDRFYRRLLVAATIALWLLVLVHLPGAITTAWWFVSGVWGGPFPGGD